MANRKRNLGRNTKYGGFTIMRNLKINAKPMFVLNYLGQTEEVDSQGFKTGETVNSYSDPIFFEASISGARGSSQAEMFGTEINYDKTIVITNRLYKLLGIDENSVFFIEHEPSYDGQNPMYDYKVSKIAETLNEVAIAISKVRAN